MKVSYRSANPRDLISFKTSIQYLPYIKDILAQFSKGVLAKMAGDLDTLEDLHELLEASIEEDKDRWKNLACRVRRTRA